jgi:hypothetical protein
VEISLLPAIKKRLIVVTCKAEGGNPREGKALKTCISKKLIGIIKELNQVGLIEKTGKKLREGINKLKLRRSIGMDLVSWLIRLINKL